MVENSVWGPISNFYINCVKYVVLSNGFEEIVLALLIFIIYHLHMQHQ